MLSSLAGTGSAEMIRASPSSRTGAALVTATPAGSPLAIGSTGAVPTDAGEKPAVVAGVGGATANCVAVPTVDVFVAEVGPEADGLTPACGATTGLTPAVTGASAPGDVSRGVAGADIAAIAGPGLGEPPTAPGAAEATASAPAGVDGSGPKPAPSGLMIVDGGGVTPATALTGGLFRGAGARPGRAAVGAGVTAVLTGAATEGNVAEAMVAPGPVLPTASGGEDADVRGVAVASGAAAASATGVVGAAMAAEGGPAKIGGVCGTPPAPADGISRWATLTGTGVVAKLRDGATAATTGAGALSVPVTRVCEPLAGRAPGTRT